MVILFWQGWGDSPTWDEVGHFAAGIEHWRKSTFRLYTVNPPLVRMVATIPAALYERGIDPYRGVVNFDAMARPEFTAGKQVAKQLGSRYFADISVARAICIPLCLLGGWTCYLWASELFGAPSGLIALFLWVFSPTILGYGHLITPDVAAASFAVFSAYLFRRWLLCPSWRRCAYAGAALGLAELTKTTLLTLALLWPIIWAFSLIVRRNAPQRASARVQLLQICTTVIISIWCVSAGYLFQGSFKPLGSYQFSSSAMNGIPLPRIEDAPPPPSVVPLHRPLGNRFSAGFLRYFPVPFPEDYVLGIDVQKCDFESHQWSYLLGTWRFGGWWYYYLFAMLIKEPVGTWVLLCLSTFLSLMGRRFRKGIIEESLLWCPVCAVLLLVSSQTGFNHHMRYVLPAFPFLFILSSRVGSYMVALGRVFSSGVVGVLAWTIVSSLLVLPHSLSYFNELAGGPRNGSVYLGNSNTDWGQDLLYLKRWVDRHPDAWPLYVAYDLPLIDPAQADVLCRQPPIDPRASPDAVWAQCTFGPVPGWYIVSVNLLRDREHRFDYLAEFEPNDRIGYTMMVYHVTTAEANALRKKLGLAAIPAGAAAE